MFWSLKSSGTLLGTLPLNMMTWMAWVTGMTGMTWMAGMTGMIWMSGMTCIIRMNRMTCNEMTGMIWMTVRPGWLEWLTWLGWMGSTSFPGFSPTCPYRGRERERPWLGLVTWLQNKINSEGAVLCLNIFCLVRFHCSNNDRKGKIFLLFFIIFFISISINTYTNKTPPKNEIIIIVIK